MDLAIKWGRKNVVADLIDNQIINNVKGELTKAFNMKCKCIYLKDLFFSHLLHSIHLNRYEVAQLLLTRILKLFEPSHHTDDIKFDGMLTDIFDNDGDWIKILLDKVCPQFL